MSENCPINELLDFLKEAIKNKNIHLPENLSLHAKECKACHDLLCSPKHWEAFVKANDAKEGSLLYGQLVTEGQVWKIDFDENEDAVMGLITDTSSLESDDFVRITPIFVAPNSKDIDEETDILLKASQMPNGLPCMIEWWNDRPVEILYLTKCYGKIDEDLFVKVKERITKPVAHQKISKSVFIFRESEKAKGDLLSASIVRKIIGEEKANVYSISFEDLYNNSSNEKLALAAATNDFYNDIDKYLKKHKAKYYVLRLAEDKEFTLGAYSGIAFDLKVTYKNNEVKVYSSNQSGKLVLNEDLLKDFMNIDFIIKE